MDDNKLRELDAQIRHDMDSDYACIALEFNEHRIEYARRLLAAIKKGRIVSDFKREHRYIVIKIKDALTYLPTHKREILDGFFDEISRARAFHGKPPLDCVVVESDWPEYEPTWKAIQSRMIASVDAERGEPSVEQLADVIRKQLTSVYICTRVWEAWQVGTMTQDDFYPAEESMFADELAEELMSLYTAPQPARDPAISLAAVMQPYTSEALHRATYDQLLTTLVEMLAEMDKVRDPAPLVAAMKYALSKCDFGDAHDTLEEALAAWEKTK